MTEAQSNEIERLLLFVSDAQERARRVAKTLENEGAPSHIVEAATTAHRELADTHRRLMQGTYYASPAEQLVI